MNTRDVKSTKVYRTLLRGARTKSQRRQLRRSLSKALTQRSCYDKSADLLRHSFVWSETPQGHDFWKNLAKDSFTLDTIAV